jgi:hypothetical protein
MEDQNKNNAEPQTATNKPAPEKLRREVSSIAFPYVNLESAEHGAKAIFGSASTTEITYAQAAGAMNASATSSGFRGDIAAMKLFGLLEGDQGRLRLTDLGRAIAEPGTTEAARVEAFDRIPLYQRLKANHNGKTLPKAQALEREIIELGVAAKQAERARQVFERSARHAGYIKPGSDRFVEPILPARSELVGGGRTGATSGQPEHDVKRTDNPGNGDPSDRRHPFIEGLLKTLPAPETEWPIAARAKWLQTAASIFGLIYTGEGEITVTYSTTSSSSPGQ